MGRQVARALLVAWTSSMRRIGYLVPDFPGQTHLFFWREISGLEGLGLEIALLSTKRPPNALRVHEWAPEAEARTNYLIPFTAADYVEAVRTLVRAGPGRVMRAVGMALRVDELSLRGKLRMLALLLPACKLASIAKARGLTHIHTPICADSANVALFAFILTGMPYSLALLGSIENFGPNQKAKWANAAFGVAMSQKLYEVLRQRLAGNLPPVLEIVPVGVDLESIARTKPYEPWVEGAPCRVYSCGRLNPVKGHVDLIDAVSILRQRGIDAHLEIAGEDDKGGHGYRREIEQHIAKCRASQFVTLLGAVPEITHKQKIAGAHLFALASHDEGISVALMEAMAMQTPVVATRVGGNDELIDTGVNGILTQSANPPLFADAMEEILRAPAKAKSLTSNSREKVLSKFDARRCAQNFYRVLNSA